MCPPDCALPDLGALDSAATTWQRRSSLYPYDISDAVEGLKDGTCQFRHLCPKVSLTYDFKQLIELS